jgi:hypothetical protein
MTNEERFIASCQKIGESDVRQKLNADRYGGQRAVWAAKWLAQVESGKSDDTEAEEIARLLTKPRRVLPGVSAFLLLMLLGGGVAFWTLR